MIVPINCTANTITTTTTTMTTTTSSSSSCFFDGEAKENQLRQEAESWDISSSNIADGIRLRDIPILDISSYLLDPTNDTIQKEVADKLREACETVGFFALVGHNIQSSLRRRLQLEMATYFNQSTEIKSQQLMDSNNNSNSSSSSSSSSNPHNNLKGVGYLPLYNRKLPTRSLPNANEAYVVKRSHDISWDQNPWPTTTITLPEQQQQQMTSSNSKSSFRSVVEEYGQAMEDLAKSLLPLFAVALDMESNYFDKAFDVPFYRLRLTHYPPQPQLQQKRKQKQPNPPKEQRQRQQQQELVVGIMPHVDTSFITILSQTHSGLIIRDERYGRSSSGRNGDGDDDNDDVVCGVDNDVDVGDSSSSFSERRRSSKRQKKEEEEWTRVPFINDSFIVNVGELLRQWTNDRFRSVKHFAINDNNDDDNNNNNNTHNSDEQEKRANSEDSSSSNDNNNKAEVITTPSSSASSRYSIPFFFNANADYVMTCIPSCCSETNPSKYPPVSYNSSQAKAQGE